MKTNRLESVLAVIAIMTLATAVAPAGGWLDQGPAQKPPVSWSASSAVVRGAAGATLRVEVSARIGEGWHLYSLTQTPPPDPTVIELAEGQAFLLDGTIEAPAPETGFDAAQGADTEYYTDEVTFRIPVTAKPGTAPGDYKVRVTARWQACNGSLCLRPQVATLDLPIQITDQKH
jgi:DsbC/DsbD-like thiol-disulfide interchange protein